MYCAKAVKDSVSQVKKILEISRIRVKHKNMENEITPPALAGHLQQPSEYHARLRKMIFLLFVCSDISEK